MNKKQLFFLSILFLIIGSLAFIQKNFNIGMYTTTKTPLTSSSLALVDTIRITQGETNTILQKQGTTWVVTSPSTSTADGKKIDTLLSRIKLLTKGEMVTDNTNKWDLYGVDNSGLRIELLENNKKIFGYILGKVTEDYTATYIRQDEENSVFRSKGLLPEEFTADSSFFRSKELTSFTEKDIAEIIIKKGNKKISIIHNDTSWESTPRSKENISLHDIVSSLLQLRIHTFSSSGHTATDVQNNPDYKLFFGRSNKELKSTVLYIKKDTSTLHGNLEGSTEVFTLDTNTASILDKLFQ